MCRSVDKCAPMWDFLEKSLKKIICFEFRRGRPVEIKKFKHCRKRKPPIMVNRRLCFDMGQIGARLS